MTELLTAAVRVRLDQDGALTAVHTAAGWRRVSRITASWLIETDWWRTPVRRLYHRCLLRNGECLELYHDREAREWCLARRYD